MLRGISAISLLKQLNAFACVEFFSRQLTDVPLPQITQACLEN